MKPQVTIVRRFFRPGRVPTTGPWPSIEAASPSTSEYGERSKLKDVFLWFADMNRHSIEKAKLVYKEHTRKCLSQRLSDKEREKRSQVDSYTLYGRK